MSFSDQEIQEAYNLIGIGTPEQISKYDLNRNGRIDYNDIALMRTAQKDSDSRTVIGAFIMLMVLLFIVSFFKR